MADEAGGQSPRLIYWNQLVLLTVVACYVRRYRDEQAWWVNRIGLFKAVVTSGTIGAWVIWKDYAFVWGVLLGAAQILDAAKEYIPQAAHRRHASEFLGVIENTVIDARFEWFEVVGGRYLDGEIMERWRSLAKLMRESEARYFPDGFPISPARERLAKMEARAYISAHYGVGDSANG